MVKGYPARRTSRKPPAPIKLPKTKGLLGGLGPRRAGFQAPASPKMPGVPGTPKRGKW